MIANHEENRRRDVERLEAAGVPVWVTYPRSVRDGVALLRELAALGAAVGCARGAGGSDRGGRRARRKRPARRARVRVFCPIWKTPWMSVGRRHLRARPARAVRRRERLRGSGASAAIRSCSSAEIVAAAPEVILLPDEPYAFGPREVAELAALDVPAAASGRIHLIDGTLVSWYGPRIQRAIETIRPLIAG